METESLPKIFGNEKLQFIKEWPDYRKPLPDGWPEPPWDFLFAAAGLIRRKFGDVSIEPSDLVLAEFLECWEIMVHRNNGVDVEAGLNKWWKRLEGWWLLREFWHGGVDGAWLTLVASLTDNSRSKEYKVRERFEPGDRGEAERREPSLKLVKAQATILKKAKPATVVVLKTIIKEIKRRRWPASYEDVLIAAWNDPKKSKPKKGRRVFAGGDEKLSELSGWSYKTVKRARWAFMKAGIWNVQRRWSWKRKRCYELYMCSSMSQVMHFKKKLATGRKTKH